MKTGQRTTGQIPTGQMKKGKMTTELLPDYRDWLM